MVHELSLGEVESAQIVPYSMSDSHESIGSIIDFSQEKLISPLYVLKARFPEAFFGPENPH